MLQKYAKLTHHGDGLVKGRGKKIAENQTKHHSPPRSAAYKPAALITAMKKANAPVNTHLQSRKAPP